jgi:hypothetical protein
VHGSTGTIYPQLVLQAAAVLEDLSRPDSTQRDELLFPKKFFNCEGMSCKCTLHTFLVLELPAPYSHALLMIVFVDLLAPLTLLWWFGAVNWIAWLC